MKSRVTYSRAVVGVAIVFVFGAMGNIHAQPHFDIVSFSTGGSSSSSTGGVYSASHVTGLGDFGRMRSPNYSVAGNFWPGMIVLPELAPGGFYIGIDLHDPVEALADYDGDGFSNLTEYALGTDPRNPADAAQGLLITVTTDAGSQYLTMQFKRRTNSLSLGLQYLPEVSADGQTWYSDAAHVLQLNVSALDNQFDWVTVRDLTATTPAAPRLIRLRVVEN